MSKIIYDDIKGIVLDVIAAYNPADCIGGQVTSVNPLQITIANTTDFLYQGELIVPENLTDYTVTIGGTPTVVSNALKPGDQVMMLKCSNGQKYYILDRVHPT